VRIAQLLKQARRLPPGVKRSLSLPPVVLQPPQVGQGAGQRFLLAALPRLAHDLAVSRQGFFRRDLLLDARQLKL